MTAVLGIGLSHDASACLIVDGKMVAGIQLERLTRIKHDGSQARASLMIEYVLDAAGLELGDLDMIGVYLSYTFDQSKQYVGPIDLTSERVIHVSHHLAHACSAFGPSEFGDAAVLVIDGNGDPTQDSLSDVIMTGPEYKETLDSRELGRLSDHAPRYETESIYHFSRTGHKLLDRVTMQYGKRLDGIGIGMNYAQAAMWLFRDIHAAGKVMGLSPYGAVRGDLEVYPAGEDGPVFSENWREVVRSELANSKQLPNDHDWASSLARSVQQSTERIVLSRADKAVRLSSSTNLCLAGGVALNAIANTRIVIDGTAEELFIQPASSDSGLSIGAAIMADKVMTGSFRGEQIPQDSAGRCYSSADVLGVLRGYK